MYAHMHLNNAPPAMCEARIALPATTVNIAPEFYDLYAEVPDHEIPDGHVYVAFGSVYAPPAAVVRDALARLASVDRRVVTAVALESPLEHVVARAYVAQSPCMPRCRAVVCHGGRNTVLTALAHGVPVVTSKGSAVAAMDYRHRFLARVCGSCGFAEFYLEDPKGFVAVTRRAPGHS